MADPNFVNDVMDEIDKDGDGKIDRRELRDFISKNVDSTSPYESSKNRKYQEAPMMTGNRNGEDVINTSGPEETKRYLQRAGINVFIDPNPQVIHRKATDRPITFEQRIQIRCLQPPPPPAPGPLIIKEVRPEQPPPPPPLIIREQPNASVAPPPIVLRERPPTPPPRIPSETKIRHLPPLPAPPRSVIIERVPNLPERPRDIIIERWCPYGPAPERETIIERAPSPAPYPDPTHTIIVYDDVQTKVNRKFERLGVSKEDPDSYIARYATPLLDSSAILREARKAGVTEDISCPLVSASAIFSGVGGKSLNYEKSNEVLNQTYSRFNDNSLTRNITETRSEYHDDESGYTGTYTKRDVDRGYEPRRYF